MLTFDRERMKYVKTQHVHQLLVGRCVLTESSQGYPQIRKEQVRACVCQWYGREGERDWTRVVGGRLNGTVTTH